jgi:cytochrome c biogenesis protein CcmG/thiol:disulfide interchange protein DsbE
MRRLLYLLPVLLFAGIAGYFLVALQRERNPGEVPSALIGKPAPDFALPALRSDLPGVARADFAGHVSFVNFFASWCVPCRAEHPFLMQLARTDGVSITGIAYKDKPGAANAFLDELGNPFTRVGNDASGRTGIDFGITGVPESFVIDRQGRICYRQWGPVTDDKVAADLLAKIKECGG